jgi:DNA repair protein RecO (recombination protein O)
MFVSTEGIVLHRVKYSDTSLIVKIFTEKFGTQSFIIKNAFSKKNKLHHTFFSSLALLELTFDDRYLHQLGFLKDVSFVKIYDQIPLDPRRNSILFFYNELLYKLLYSSFEDPKLFRIVKNGMLKLDDPNSFQLDQHICFVVELIAALGLQPLNNYDQSTPFFCMESHSFCDLYVQNEAFLSQEASLYYSRLMSGEPCVLPPKSIRNELLTGLVHYIIRTNEQVHSIDSLSVLIELMR